MTEDQLGAIRCEIKDSFHYVEYPTNVDSGLWKDRGGEIKFMEEMDLGHLKNAIKKVESDLARLSRSRREPEVIEALTPLANQILDELKKAFYLKLNA